MKRNPQQEDRVVQGVFATHVLEWGLIDKKAQAELEGLVEDKSLSDLDLSLVHSKLAWHFSTIGDAAKADRHSIKVATEHQSSPQIDAALRAIAANSLLAESKETAALELLDEIDFRGLNSSHIGRLLSLKGSIQRRIGDYKNAEITLENAKYLLHDVSKSLFGLSLSRLGVLYANQSEFVLAGRYFSRASEQFSGDGNSLWKSRARFNEAIACRKSGRLISARDIIADLVESRIEQTLQARYHNEYARLYIALEDKKTASYLLRLIEDYTDENTPIRSRVITCEAEADFHCLSRDWDHALAALGRGIEIALTISKSNDLLAELYRRKARVLYEIGMDDEAYDMAKESLEICHQVNEIYEIGANFRTLGLVAERRGEYHEAESLLDQAVNFYQSKDEKFERAHSHRDFASFYHRRGDKEALRKAFKQAATAMGLFEEMGVESRVLEMRELLETLSKQIPRKPFIVPDGHQLAQIGEEHGIITGDAKVKQVLEAMVRVAPTASSILVTGETGTGKELVARAIHAMSDRAEKPMIVVNCAAIPRELMESEIFGHLKGSFTGAASDRVGKFEMANQGTLFLDEIGDLDQQLQAKLLRVLEDGSYTPVGADKERHADVRVISATNRNLAELIKKRQFREDLLYRLNEVMLQLPPLRDRPGDAELLTLYFLHQEGDLIGNSVQIDPHALDLIVHHNWSGNVRQLLGFLRQLIINAQNTGLITVDLFPDHFFERSRKEPRNLAGIVREAERKAILDALIRAKGNKAKAARDLEVSRSTLGDKITRLELDEEIEQILEREQRQGDR